jgi:hypothetical protein
LPLPPRALAPQAFNQSNQPHQFNQFNQLNQPNPQTNLCLALCSLPYAESSFKLKKRPGFPVIPP